MLHNIVILIYYTKGHLCQPLSFLTLWGGGIEKFCFKLSIVAFLSINAFAATQVNTTDNRNFNILEHYFNDNELYDKTNSIYKKLQGINYYAKSSKQDINNITLIYNNPKSNTSNINDLNFKHYLLTPNMREDEVLSFKARHGVNTADHSIKTVRVLPFLITAKTDHADASYNKLILKQGKLSSVFYLKPKDINIKNPSNSKSDQHMNFLMSSTFTHYGNASYNQTILQKDAHISMGVESTYDLALNGAPYLIGAIATYGDSINNSLNIEAGSSVEFFTSLPKKDKNGNNTFDERITHLIGGLAYQGNVKNNKIFIKDANMIIHGPSKAYASLAAAHISAGYIDSGTDKNFQASKNLLDIDGFNLDMYMKPLAYNSVLFADFWAGKTEQGQALDNTINLKDIKNLKKR